MDDVDNINEQVLPLPEQAEPLAEIVAQPVVSGRVTIAPIPEDNDKMKVIVAPRGHGKISNGHDLGFERYAAGAVVEVSVSAALNLYDRQYVVPQDSADLARIEALRRKIDRADRAELQRQRDITERGTAEEDGFGYYGR